MTRPSPSSIYSFALSILLVLPWSGSSIWPNVRILLLPVFVTLAALAVIGPSLLITALERPVRDFRTTSSPSSCSSGSTSRRSGFSAAPPVRERAEVSICVYLHDPMVSVIDGSLGDPARRGRVITRPGWLRRSLVVACFLWLGVRVFPAHRAGFLRCHPAAGRRRWLYTMAEPIIRWFWAPGDLRDVSFDVPQGRSVHHRPQRLARHAAQDPEPDHRADGRR